MRNRGKGKDSSRDATKKDPGKKSSDKKTKETLSGSPAPAPASSLHRHFVTRISISICALAVLQWYSWYTLQQSMDVIAKADDYVKGKLHAVPCSSSFLEEKNLYPDCFPKKCGRGVSDDIVSEGEAQLLLQLAQEGISLGGSSGGASILDIHSGALSKDDKFINIYKILDTNQSMWFTENTFKMYSIIRSRIQQAIAVQFEISPKYLHLTSPTFFSRMTTKDAQTVHDEYWHVHVDKETYGSFHYTSLIYLNTYNTDFTGGRFVFVDENKNVTVEPKQGRLLFFTSGAENPHFVEKLDSGVRYAVTVSFTCDKTKAIADPVLQDKLK